MRLTNNSISDVAVLSDRCVSQTLDPASVLWLDLSFNQLERLDASLGVMYPNLTTLHLHANLISRLSDIKKLGMFPHLKSVSMYGNPVEEHKHYRVRTPLAAFEILWYNFVATRSVISHPKKYYLDLILTIKI